MSDPVLLFKLLLLLGIANGAPVFATKLFKDRLAMPLDGGLTFADGRPLLGASKTIRGIVAALLCTTLAAPLLSLDWRLGAIVAVAAMAGDLASSFLKRRLGLKVHAQAFGLDQIPEALVPLLVVQARLGLQPIDIAAVMLAFVLLEILLSWLLFRLRIREQPY